MSHVLEFNKLFMLNMHVENLFVFLSFVFIIKIEFEMDGNQRGTGGRLLINCFHMLSPELIKVKIN